MAANLELGYKCLLNCFLVGLGKRAKLADPRMRIQRQNPQTLKTQKFGIGGSFGMQRERERNRERERDQLAFATWLAFLGFVFVGSGLFGEVGIGRLLSCLYLFIYFLG